jgi:hypothetical protein
MLRAAAAIVVGVGLAAAACSHEGAAPAGPASAGSAWQQAKRDFVSAYDAVRAGTERTATAGKYAIEDAGHGIVRVTDASKEGIARAGESAKDAWITTKIKSEYALDRGVQSSHVHVDTEDGVVRLGGAVESPAAAQRAIEIALAAKGVVAVDSKLQYPTRPLPQRLYLPGESSLPKL